MREGSLDAGRGMTSFGKAARLLAVIVAAWSAWPVAALASSGPWASGRTVRARLVTATDATGADRQLHAGLQVVLDDGWDTYWRSPGDAGAPPRVDWSASTNVASVDWRWPAPIRMSQFGIDTFGYLHEVVFPLIVHLQRQGEKVSLRAAADLLVCSTICVPRHLDLTLDLPAGAATTDAAAANLIARFDARVPDGGTLSGLIVDGLTVQSGNPGFLNVGIAARQPLAAPDVIVESPKWSFGKPAFSFASDGKAAVARLPITSGPDAVGLVGADVIVTVTDGPRASETTGIVKAGAALGRGWAGALLPFLGVALLGGLILNLMPCVLPVLAMKLASVLRTQGQERRRVRLGFLAMAAGIVVSMLALAGILAGLKAAGVAVGWGIQFQQPMFLVLMTAALVAFAASLSGMFEIALPARLATRLGRGGGGTGLGGDFAAGAFASVLATPCSAPFVGTAVAFALARGPTEILAIFAVLGLGLAAPPLAVAAFPGMVRLLPRPGRWMVTLRLVLAAALIGTALWLLTVLAAQTSWRAAGAVGVALAVLAACLALRPRFGVPATASLAVLAVLAAVAAPVLLRAVPVRESATAWVPFGQASIPRLVAEGKTVFVDVTADWCLTCQANRALVIDRPEVAAALSAPGVVPMRADWTRPDGAISDYLARNGRFGIPMNAVYGPGAPRGILLSEVLTREAVLDALRRARGETRLSER